MNMVYLGPDLIMKHTQQTLLFSWRHVGSLPSSLPCWSRSFCPAEPLPFTFQQMNLKYSLYMLEKGQIPILGNCRSIISNLIQQYFLLKNSKEKILQSSIMCKTPILKWENRFRGWINCLWSYGCWFGGCRFGCEWEEQNRSQFLSVSLPSGTQTQGHSSSPLGHLCLHGAKWWHSHSNNKKEERI